MQILERKEGHALQFFLDVFVTYYLFCFLEIVLHSLSCCLVEFPATTQLNINQSEAYQFICYPRNS